MSRDAAFTGASSIMSPPESIRVTVPMIVHINEVEEVTRGEVTQRWYDWRVTFQGTETARCNTINGPRPRTRKAAIGQAKAAIRRRFA